MKEIKQSYQYGLDMPNLIDVLPQGPGVYLFKDESGRVLYVGKAKNLRKRLLAYLRPTAELSHKTSVVIKRAKGLDFILTSSEKEALILESTMIKKHLPKYNIVLRDDSQYPCLRLSVMEEFPRLSIARKIKRDGARYFGPFSSAGAVRNTLKVIDKVFQLRKCKGDVVKTRERPCLNYQMGRCLAPCTGKVSSEEYREVVNQVILFLEGRNRELIAELKTKMKKAAEKLEFEQAAKIRDQIHAIEKTIERQHVVSTKLEDQDVIGMARSGDFFVVVVLSIRNGYLISSRDYSLRTRGEPPSEVMEAFIKQYYLKEGFVPKEILLSDSVEDEASITEWLSEVAKVKVNIKVPKKGEKRRLVEMAISNAQNVLKSKEVSGEIRLAENIKNALGLPIIPRHIEAMDISNLFGNLAVGTIVGFVDGKADKSLYRNYRIRTVKGINDYAMIAEVAQRRFAQGNLPDLFLIDGGKGQLGVVRDVLERHGAHDSPVVVALAKADYKKGEVVDKIYVENRPDPVMLKPHDPVLLFLMRVRDEVHRRAIAYHREIRRKGLTESILLEIPGVGKKRAQKLLQRFSSLEHIKHASKQDLIKVGGVSQSVAENIRSFFEQKK